MKKCLFAMIIAVSIWGAFILWMKLPPATGYPLLPWLPHGKHWLVVGAMLSSLVFPVVVAWTRPHSRCVWIAFALDLVFAAAWATFLIHYVFFCRTC
ncbi:hypothetical protein L6R52_29670 [Myxococcota bacterium]|nr:hypothetical protein [Myxococcota bacterium]